MYQNCINLLGLNMCLLLLANIPAYGYLRVTYWPSRPELDIIYYGIISIGLWQLLYVIPLCLFLKWRRKPEEIRGVILGAVITALVNSPCWLNVPILLLR